MPLLETGRCQPHQQNQGCQEYTTVSARRTGVVVRSSASRGRRRTMHSCRPAVSCGDYAVTRVQTTELSGRKTYPVMIIVRELNDLLEQRGTQGTRV